MTNDKPQPLSYATPGIGPLRESRFDNGMIFFAAPQALLAALVCAAALHEPVYGYTEISNTAWYVRLAWQLSEMNTWYFGWGILSLIALYGAFRPPNRHQRWYIIYVLSMLAAIIIVGLSLWLLIRSNTSYRWVSTYDGAPTPHQWEQFAASTDSAVYWQIPLAVAIANPAAILLAYRAMRPPPRQAAQNA